MLQRGNQFFQSFSFTDQFQAVRAYLPSHRIQFFQYALVEIFRRLCLALERLCQAVLLPRAWI